MIDWQIHHREVTASTNLDARTGTHGDVFTADYQTEGRGCRNHVWVSPAKTNLMMSVVLSVEGLTPEQIVTLLLVIGLSVCKAMSSMVAEGAFQLKWPNDVLMRGKKVAGVLCERNGDKMIVGIGVNVNQRDFPFEIVDRATSILLETGRELEVTAVRNALLGQLDKWYGIWRERGFAAVYPEIAAVDAQRGRTVSIRMDDDANFITGVSNGIMQDGSLDVGGWRVSPRSVRDYREQHTTRSSSHRESPYAEGSKCATMSTKPKGMNP